MRVTVGLFNRWHPMSVKYSNLPNRYIKRTMEQVYWRTPRRPNYLPRTIERKKFVFTEDRPWTKEFYKANYPGKHVEEPIVEPLRNWSFFRGDRVEILYGRDKGKQGTVSQIVAERNWVFVDGLNAKLELMGKTDEYPGYYIVKELPLLVTTDVKLVDPSDLKGTDIEWRYTAEGERVRVSVRTGRIIPIPVSDDETIDYKAPHLYKDKVKDTPKSDVEEVTFKPELKTFEMDIMEKMGIKEDRVPQKYWWY